MQTYGEDRCQLMPSFDWTWSECSKECDEGIETASQTIITKINLVEQCMILRQLVRVILLMCNRIAGNFQEISPCTVSCGGVRQLAFNVQT